MIWNLLGPFPVVEVYPDDMFYSIDKDSQP